MKKYGIIVDSTSGLTKAEATKLGYGYLPISIIDGEKQFHEGVDISIEECVERLNNDHDMSTSQPSFGEIQELEKEWNKKFDKYFILCLSKGISGTYDALVKYFSERKDEVKVVDTYSTSYCISRIANKLEEWQEEGIDDFNELGQRADSLKDKYKLVIAPENLKQLKKGGRVNGAAAAIADVIGIKPLLEMKNTLERTGKGRGFKKSYSKIIDMIIEDCEKPEVVKVAQFGGCDKNIELALQLVKERFEVDAEVIKISAAIGVHTGVGTVGIMAFWD